MPWQEGSALVKKALTPWVSQFFNWDSAVALLLTLGILAAILLAGTCSNPVSEISPNTRSALYGRVAVIAGTFASVGIATIAFTAPTLRGARFRGLRLHPDFDRLWKTHTTALRVYATLSALSLVCLVFDTGPRTNLALWLPFVFCALRFVFVLVRSIRILELTVRASLRASTSDGLAQDEKSPLG